MLGMSDICDPPRSASLVDAEAALLSSMRGFCQPAGLRPAAPGAARRLPQAGLFWGASPWPAFGAFRGASPPIPRLGDRGWSPKTSSAFYAFSQPLPGVHAQTMRSTVNSVHVHLYCESSTALGKGMSTLLIKFPYISHSPS